MHLLDTFNVVIRPLKMILEAFEKTFSLKSTLKVDFESLPKVDFVDFFNENFFSNASKNFFMSLRTTLKVSRRCV